MDFHSTRNMFEAASSSQPDTNISNLKKASSIIPTKPPTPPSTIQVSTFLSNNNSPSTSAWESSAIPHSIPIPPSPPPLPNMPPLSPLTLQNNNHRRSLNLSSPLPPRSPISSSQLRSPLPRGRVSSGRNNDRPIPSRPISNSRVRPIIEDNEESDYSDVGDYSADQDFYVPGVNDPDDLIHSSSNHRPSSSTIVSSSINYTQPSQSHSISSNQYNQSNRQSINASSSSRRNSINRRTSYDDNSSFADIAEDASTDDHEGDDLEFDDHNNNHLDAVVRQDSNFSRLSAQSWLTVDSAQDVDVHDDSNQSTNPPLQIREKDEYQSTSERRFSNDNDHDPATLFNVDIRADCMEYLKRKSYHEMSVFECCATLQAGVPASKKKSLRRYGARRVWLSSDCSRLFWTSKKPDIAADHIKLQKVAKLCNKDREVSIDVTEGYRITLLFNTTEMAGTWVKALSCLIPLQARVQEALRGMIPPDKEREDYNLADDIFNGRPLREYLAVNSYVVLCAARGQTQSTGNKFAFSRSDGAFCGLRYIPHNKVRLLLGTDRDIAVLKRLDHRNIVRYHECLKDPEHGGNYVVFEHVARGCLMDSSKLEGVQPMTEQSARDVMLDLINGLDYLHKLRIVHGDIRPDNLLRAVDSFVKINPIGCIPYDFFDLNNLIPLTRARLGNESHAFLAPEQCWLTDAPMSPPNNYAIDIWAIGVVMYFMLYGRVPFGGRNSVAIQESICNGRLRFPKVPQTSRKARTLMRRILSQRNPNDRLTLEDIRADSWFHDSEQGYNDTTINDSYEELRVIVSAEEIGSAVQQAKVRVAASSRR